METVITLETITIGFVIAMALMMVIGGVLVYLQLRQIHAAVNSNMTTALNKIEDLHGRVAELVSEARHKAEDEKKDKEEAGT